MNTSNFSFKSRWTFIAVLLFAGLFSSAYAQGGVPKDATEFTVDGIKVILNPTKANQIVAVLLGIEGGFARNETENPAIAAVTADLTTSSGSQKYPKDKYREELARLVTTIGGSGGKYNSTYLLSCVKPKFSESWNIFQDVIKNPRYDEDEFARIKEQDLTAIAGRKAEPEDYANFMLDSIWSAANHSGRVTQASDIEALSTDAIKQFHDGQLQRSRMTIVVVGDVTKAELEKKIHEAFKDVPMGSYAHQPFETVMGPQRTDLVIDNRVVPTAYIFGRFLAPSRTSNDYWPLRISSLILRDRLYEEVRTKRNLSYAPFATLTGSTGAYYGLVGVSTTMPDSTINVMNREIRKMRDQGITEKELRDIKAQYVTEYYMQQQSNLAVAQSLYQMQMETGNWKNLFAVPQNIDKVSLADVRRVTSKYYHNIFWTAVGEQDKMTRSLFLFP